MPRISRRIYILLGFTILGCVSMSSCSDRQPAPSEQGLSVTTTPSQPTSQSSSLQAIALEPVAEERNPHMLRADRTKWVNGSGEQVILRGCNLGNWLLLEMWMLDWSHMQDQYDMERTLAKRFGAAEKNRLMEIYREHWITERDFRMIRSFGFNCIRLPFNYRILMEEEGPLELKPDAFKWLDRGIELARKHGLYVILDMHGMPGGQSVDHTTGRRGQNRLWEPKNQKKSAWLWQRIAERYKDSAVVAAYDLINEPFGDYRSEDHIPALVETMELIYEAVREVDPHHIVMMSGSHGIEIYGRPEDHGWENVAYTEHFYPGLFGGDPTKDTHARFICRAIPYKASYLEELGVPFLVGEFNAVFQNVGGAALMRKYFDVYAENNWAATMWCYKLLQKAGGVGVDNWFMVKNRDPLPPVDPATSSKEEIETYFKSFSTMEYGVYENLGAAMTMPSAPSPKLPKLPELPVKPSAIEDVSPWQATDIGGALEGGQKMLSEKSMEIYAGGEDIWNVRDQFRLVSQEVSGDFYLAATVDALVDSHIYAKAGLMLRSGMEPNAAMILLNVFPDGELVLAWREQPGEEMQQKRVSGAEIPVRMRIVRKGTMMEVAFVEQGGQWTSHRIRLGTALRSGGHAGFAVLSHDNRALTSAAFSDIRFTTR